jgi:uncharacterized protein
MNTMTHHLWIGFAGGLLAFAHCVGMCGGFVLHLAQEKDRTRMLAGQVLWQAGRGTTYVFLGALAGFAGGFVENFLSHSVFQNLLSYTAGFMILLMGLSLLGLLPVRGNGAGGAAVGAIASMAGKLFAGGSTGKSLFLGIATGFLPCPIILAFLAYALQSGSVLDGMAIMAALAAGTMVPLLLLGSLTRLTGLHLRSWGPKAGGVILIILGLTTTLRGTEAFHHLLGCPSKPSLQAQSQETAPMKPCCAGKVHGNSSN